jgi:hypothetical protein
MWAVFFVLTGCGDVASDSGDMTLDDAQGPPALGDSSRLPSLDGRDDGGGSGGGGGSAPAPVAAAPVCSATSAPELTWEGAGECEDSPGTARRTLPGTGVEYCIKAHPDCSAPGASCPLFVMANTGGAYFGRVDNPAENGTIIVAESYGPRDGNDVKDWVAELPRVVGEDYVGLDRERIYFVGWSAGAGAGTRGLCQSSKGFDESPYGTTSDLYAALVTAGGCPGCSSNFEQIAGNWHTFAVNGREDIFGGDGCKEKLDQIAETNGCDVAGAEWTNVTEGDNYMRGGNGTDIAQRLAYAGCTRGSVVSYRFKDEEHVLSFKKHFDPRVRAYEMIWTFLQGRTKTGGSSDTEPVCRL